VYQENSYYPFGLIMPGTTVAMPATPNKQLYNGGSEWQNDYSNLPNYYQTFNRNYDAAIGRFISADPMPERRIGYEYLSLCRG
jgi:RHS repeat-associated protein